MHRGLSVLLLLSAQAVHAAGPEDLLEPDKAFRFSARALDADTVEVRFKIAAGYYLYRDRFRFAVEPASASVGAARFPDGEFHDDKFFGKQVTYRKDVRILLPLRSAGADRVKLTVTSQGCADIGVCYLPQSHSAELRLAPLSGARSSILQNEDPVASSPEPAREASEDCGRPY